MDLSNFIIRIVFLVIPGIVSYFLFHTLNGRRSKKDWEDYLEIGAFSFLSYSILGITFDIHNILFANKWSLVFFNTLLDEKPSIVWYEVYLATFIAVILALFTSWLRSNDVINTLGQRFGLTTMFGNKDVWILFQKRYGLQWVFVRDHKTNLTYFGQIIAYSDTDQERELVIENVIVFNDASGEQMYNSDILYISRKRDDLMIELPENTFHIKPITSPKENSVITKEKTEHE